jgi:hypothetical protein
MLILRRREKAFGAESKERSEEHNLHVPCQYGFPTIQDNAIVHSLEPFGSRKFHN